MSCNKVVARYVEPLTGGTFMNFNSSSTAVMALTATLIQLMQPVQIDQGCKIQNNLSLGSYSLPSNLWVETTAIQSGSITTSNNITAGGSIYASDGLIKGKNLDITIDIELGGTLKTKRTDETFLFKATKYMFYDKIVYEIFGHFFIL